MPEHLLSGSDAELIRCLKQRQQKALAVLYDKYAAVLLGLIERIVGDPKIAGEILQQVFINVWQQISEFDVRKTSLLNWMLNLARHTALKVIKPAPPNHPSNIHSGENHVYTITDLPENRMTTDQQITFQPAADRERTVLELIYFKNATFREVSDQLGMEEETVKSTFLSAINTRK